MNIFGFTLSRQKDTEKKSKEAEEHASFSPPIDQDGTAVISTASGAGYFGHFIDIDGTSIKNERDLILKYRVAAANADCDAAISDIVNASIVSDMNSAPVSLTIDDLTDIDKNVKKKIIDEFENIISLLNFSENGHEYYRRWYIDGRSYFHVIIDNDNPKNGIQKIQEIDPTRIRKVREITTKIDKLTGAKTMFTSAEYYQFSEMNLGQDAGSSIPLNAIKISNDSIVYIPSGLLDENRKTVLSHLHKALKLVNQLNKMEDSLVIYRISRAPERRVFYIDVGNLPKGKAEEYVQSIMSKYRNKLIYDAETGEIRDDRRSMSIMEDFWLPRKEGGRGTEIQTLPGGENLGQIEDIMYFQRKLYRALNVPTTRLEPETGFNVGRSTEISRDEIKFHKFITRLRQRFSYLFLDLLRIQLILKAIITEDDWDYIKENVSVDFSEDNFFSELKEFEILRERLGVVGEVSQYVGKYFSDKWIRSNILRQNEQDIERIDAEIAAEGSAEDDDAEDDDAADDGVE